MKKLNETWKQKKSLTGLKNDPSETQYKAASTGTKRLGRVAITSTSRFPNSGNESRLGGSRLSAARTTSHSPHPKSSASAESFITSSFACDFDADVIQLVDSLEAELNNEESGEHNTCGQGNKSTFRTPTRQSLRQTNASTSNRGKRKNSRSRRSGATKPSLFGEVSGSGGILGECFTPTHSPRDKKRKGCGKEAEGKSSSGLALVPSLSPVRKGKALHSASHSPVLKAACQGHVSGSKSHRGTSSSSAASHPLSKSRTSHASDDCNLLQDNDLEAEDRGEIETDTSPLLDISKPKADLSNPRASISVARCRPDVSKPSVDSASSGSSKLSNTSNSKGVAKSHQLSSRTSSHDSKGNDASILWQNCGKKSDVLGQSSDLSHKDLGPRMAGGIMGKETSFQGNSGKVKQREHDSDQKLRALSGNNVSGNQNSDRQQNLDKKNVPAAETGTKTTIPSQAPSLSSSGKRENGVTTGSSLHGKKSAPSMSSTVVRDSPLEDGAQSVEKFPTPVTPKGTSNPVVHLQQRSDHSADQVQSSTDGIQSTTESIGQDNQSAETLLLSSWGLPGPVLEAYHSQGITTMFPWQAQCLTIGNVLGGGNLVYSAPTSAGKTMVAELLILKRVLETRRKALFILPFVSVTREKMVSLQHLYQDAGVRVGGFMGSYSATGGLRSLDVAVCTIEKGNGLVNRLMEEDRMEELGIIVIDELHMVGDSNRGYLLELLLTKICYMAHKCREKGISPIQVVGMSATLPNLSLLATWLTADLFHTDFRPVPLTEVIKVGTTVYDQDMTKVREIDVKATFQGDEDHIVPLCLETMMGGHSVLIFCPTKVWCEKMAERIAREFYGINKNPAALAAYTGDTGFVKASEMARLPLDLASLHSVLEQLGRSPVGVDPMLGKLIQYGVAYHHAGLTFDERDIIEGAFRQGLLKILVATSTLSSGVNLPARRVIVRSPMFGNRVMDALTYKQMAGRAGRKGVDTEGECVLVCKEREKKTAQNLVRTDLPPVASCLRSREEDVQLSRSMKRAILEVVVSGVASTPQDVARYVSCTLLSASLPPEDSSTAQLISACLAFLEDNEFVTLHASQDADGGEVKRYQPTQLGSAVLSSSMSPDEGLAVFAELQKARRCFVLANELHIIYLVTPIYSQEISSKLDWYQFYYLWEKLSPDMQLVARTVGVEEGFLAKAVTGRIPTKTAAQARAVAVHRRFYTALALHDLVQEVPLLEVADRFNCNKGQLQSLMQSAATFAGMVTVFCARLGWTNMELLLSQFQQRLTLGVTRELCDLVRIPLLTGTMARMLFNAGYQTVASVAHAVPEDVETVFRKASPFQSNKKQDGESDWEMEQRRKAHCVWLAGRKGVTELEAATAIIDEAKTIIQQELGVRIDWQGDAANQSTASEGLESLSASRTVLNLSKDASVLCEESPELSRKYPSKGNSPKCSENGRGAEKNSETLAGVSEARWDVHSKKDSETSPTLSKRKRASTEFETPVSTSRSRKSLLSCRSTLKRSSSKRRSSNTKSPPSGGRNASTVTGRRSTGSPRDVSFFGQVVVSPPPVLRKTSQTRPSRLLAKRLSDQEAGGGHSSIAAPAKGADSPVEVVPCPSVQIAAGPSGEKAGVTSQRTHLDSGHLQSVHSKTAACDDGTNGIELNHNQGVVSEEHGVTLKTKRLSSTTENSKVTKDENLVDKKSVLENVRAKGIDETTGHRADFGGQRKPIQDHNVPVSKQRANLETVEKLVNEANGVVVEEKPVCQESDADYDNCFDDSLIFNTQTDYLVSEHFSNSNSVSDKLFQAAKSSTPILHSVPSKVSGKSVCESKKVSVERGANNNAIKSCAQKSSKGGTAEYDVKKIGPLNPNSTASHVMSSQSPSALESYGEAETEKNKTENDSVRHQLVSGPASTSPQLTVDEENFTEDLFASPFPSGVSPVENHKQPSKLNSRYNLETASAKQDALPPQVSQGEGEAFSPCDSETDTSAELIAASNYDRVAYMEEGVTVDSADMSYQDLGISASGACSGQLVCEDKDPEERDDRGSTQTRADVHRISRPEEYDVREDLAIAMNMSESFTSTVNASAGSKQSLNNSGASLDNANAEVARKGTDTVFGSGIDVDGFSNSFTASMMEKAFGDNLISDSVEKSASGVELADQDTGKAPSKLNKGCAVNAPPSKKDLESARSQEANNLAEKGVGRKKSAIQNSKRISAGSAAPNDNEFIPPTPPEENLSSAPTPCPRRTPLRSCRTRADGRSQAQASCSSSTKDRKKPTAPKGKENLRNEDRACSSRRNLAVSGSVAKEPSKDVTESSDKVARSSFNQPNNKTAEVDDQSTRLTVANEAELDKGVGADSPPLTQDSLCVIDVCSNVDLFATFVEEWRSQSAYAVSVACEKRPTLRMPGGGIGGNYVQGKTGGPEEASKVLGLDIPGDEERMIMGLSVSWADHDAYYVSFLPENTDAPSLDGTLAAPPPTQSLDQEQIILAVRQVLQLTDSLTSPHTVIAFDSKSCYSVLARGLGAVFGKCQDPQIASWLMDPGAKQKTLHGMVTNYLPADLPLIEDIGGGVGYGSLGLTVGNPGSGRLRAVVESIVCRRLMDHFHPLLAQAGLEKAFTHTEMPSVLTMARMELNGFGFSNEECESQKNVMMSRLSALEQEAYALAGHPFSLTSTDDIGQILYLELQLPVNGDPSASKPVRTLGPSRRGPKSRHPHRSAFSTSKDVLEKLKPFHPLPGLILEWRRISSALTKHVYPLQKEKVTSGRVDMDRIYSECQMHTATGRVSLMEPNLQNIPKDFDILLPDVIGESPPVNQPALTAVGLASARKKAGNSRLQAMRGVTPQTARVSNPATATHMAVSMRHAFVPFPGGVILAADYSQLELRVIAHLSGDRKLMTILNNDGDVFKLIAAQWKNTLPEAVTAEERQHAKQLCYGMLYGIGAKALGEQIGVDENEATVFMESFKAKYTGMRSYLRKTVEGCRENGYVSTITGRRRYLPAIKDTNPHARAQAERQAVNTTVQGSAADIVKSAMNVIDRELARTYPDTVFPHRHRHVQQGSSDSTGPKGAFLVLQLHDELIYEVTGSEVTKVATLIKRHMEMTTQLAVKLPVKVKVGHSWGRFEDMEL